MSVLLKLIVFISFSTSLVLSMEEIDPNQLKGRALVKYRNDLKEKEKEGRRKRSEAAAKERAEKEEAEALRLRNIEQAAREAAAKERKEKEETDARQREERERMAAEKLASEFQDQLSIVGLLPEAAVAVEKKKQPSKAERREPKRLAEEREKETEDKRVAVAIAAKAQKEKTDQAKLAKRREGIDPKTIIMASCHFQHLGSALDASLIAAASNLALGAAMNNVLLNIDFRVAKLWPHKESFLAYLNLRQGDPQAIYQLGRCHEDGFAVPKKDINAAKNCFRRAANAGHEKARERLHTLEYGGGKAVSSLIEFVGSSSEQKITYKVLQDAIAGDPEAQFHVGYSYENGFGIC